MISERHLNAVIIDGPEAGLEVDVSMPPPRQLARRVGDVVVVYEPCGYNSRGQLQWTVEEV